MTKSSPRTDRAGAEYWLYQNHRHLWGIMKALEHGKKSKYSGEVKALWDAVDEADREILKAVGKGGVPSVAR